MDPSIPLADNARLDPLVPDVGANKENTPPEGNSTPTRDERSQSSSSQGSLPCAVGNFQLIKVVSFLVLTCCNSFCSKILGKILYHVVFFLQQGPPTAQSLRVLTENRGRGRGTNGVLDWPYPTMLDLPTPGRSSRSDEDTMRADYMASHASQASTQPMNPTPTGE